MNELNIHKVYSPAQTGEFTDIDPVRTEIIRHSLNSAANQMKHALCRTAFSPVIYEVLDFAVAIYNEKYELLAQAPSLPLFMGTLNFCVEAAVEGIGGVQNLFPEDVIIYNNPYGTGSHQQDVALVSPVFHADELIGFAAIKAHWLDIGAKDPYCSDTVDYFQEGTIFPGVKLFDRGRLVQSVHRIIMANSRLPKSGDGDMRAQCIGLKIGIVAFLQVVERYGINAFRQCVEKIFYHSEQAVRNYFAQIPDGNYTARGLMDNDGITKDKIPYEITVSVKGSEVSIDFSNAPQIQQGPVNCPLPSTISAARVAISMLAGGGESPTQGHFRPIRVITKKNTIFHPSPPAPCFLYGWPALQAIETIYRAFGKKFPQLVPADSGGDICSMVWWGKHSETGEAWIEGAPHPVGQGAHQSGDGSTVLHIAESATRFTPTEVRESKYPFLLNKVELATDSGGAGKYRGGLGIDFEFETLDDIYLTATLERTLTPPGGLKGGLQGRPNNMISFYPNGSQETIGKITRRFLPKGTRLLLQTGGGGGYGNPLERTEESVLSDIKNEYISAEQAKALYSKK